MKKILLALVFALLCNFSPGQAIQTKSRADTFSSQLKIGIYDSRLVTYAYFASELFQQEQKKVRAERDAVIKSQDTAKWKETMIKVCTEEYVRHQRVLGGGSAASILKKIETQLPAVAKSAGVDIIVSKWELTWNHPDAVLVDLTDSIVQLFAPLDKVGKFYDQIKKADKMEVDDVDMGEVIEMWQMFEAKYLGKKPS